MAQTIKIKRSTSAAAPSSPLGAGELAYSFNSNKLFIGDGSNNDIIGGQLYTDMLDHTAGTLTASSAIIVDSNSKIDNLLVDNLQLNGNTVSSTSGNLILSSTTGSISLAGAATEILIIDGSSTAFTITEGSNNYLTLDTTNAAEKVVFNKQIEVGLDGTPGYTLPTADGTSGQALITDGSGAVTFTTISTILTVGADTGSNDNVSLISDTLTFTGGEGIDTAVTDNTITITGEDASTTNKGVASFNTTNFTVSSGAVSAKDITLTAEDSSTAAASIGEGFTFAAGEGINTTASGTTVTITGENATSSNKGIASFDSTDFTVTNGAVAVNAITLGSSSLNPGATTTDVAGLTSLAVDNLTLNGNEITSTDTNGNISLNPNGSGVIDVNNSRISNITDPTATQDAATKGYVDAVKQALDIKDSVRVATTANITIATALNVGDTIDGVTLADGDRVLVKNQTTGSENGIYTAGTTPARATDANISAEVTSGMFCFVEEGTVGGDNGFVLTTNDPITLDTTALTFVQFSGAGQVIAGDALSKSGNTLNVNDDNITLEVSSDTLRLKGITATAKGDIVLGAATNGGYTRHVKPSSTATTNTYLLSMDTSGNAVWGDVIDGGSF
tara:strand:+ start:1144 stop:3000 length:1857 start_codon:yes stop_codon:yes gene_type:complete